jgi:diacylglycerol kinase family enzyme
MDLWLFEGDTLGDTIQRLWDLYAGRHVDSDKVRHISFEHLKLESDSHLFVQVDAEPLFTDSQSIEVDVIKQGLRLLVPDVTPRELFRH